MDWLVLTREQAKRGCRQKVAVKTLDGEDVVVTVGVPSGVKRRQKIRLRKEMLKKSVPGGHAWPDEVVIRVRAPDWRLRNGLTAIFVLAGLLAGAWQYAAVLAAVWGAAAFCARYRRQHRADELDPRMTRGFWPRFRLAFATNALRYLLPIGMALALYLSLALAINRTQHLLTVRELISIQSTLSSLSDFFDRWVKLGDQPLFLLLLGVYLLTCLLLARQGGKKGVLSTGAAGRLRRMRYGLAAALHRIVEAHGRYSGPIAVTLATLASFTFLVNTFTPFSTQLRLQAVENTSDYRYAAQKITEELDTQVVSQVYAEVRAAMPASYRRALSGTSFPAQAGLLLEQVGLLTAPLPQIRPAGGRAPTAGQAVIRRMQSLPLRPTIDGSRVDPGAVPGDITARQAEAAREWVTSHPPGPGLELISDGGKEVVLQAGAVVTGPFWEKVRELVNHQYPLAAPMVDAMSEAFSEQLQEGVYQQVPPLVRKIMAKAHDMTVSVNASARDVVAGVNISELLRGHIADARRLAAERMAILAERRRRAEKQAARLRRLAAQARRRADQSRRAAHLVERIIVNQPGIGFDQTVPVVLRSSPSVQVKVVRKLMTVVQADWSELLKIQNEYYLEGDPQILKMNAARAIQHLAPDLPGIITAEDVSIANANCGCP